MWSKWYFLIRRCNNFVQELLQKGESRAIMLLLMKLRIWKKICIFALATAFASPFAACVNEDEASSLPSTESSTATESGLNSSEGRESSEAESSTEESSSSDGSSVGKDSSSSAPERVRVDCGEYSLVFTMDGEGGCFLSAVQGTPAEVVVPERVNGAAVTAIGQRSGEKNHPARHRRTHRPARLLRLHRADGNPSV